VNERKLRLLVQLFEKQLREIEYMLVVLERQLKLLEKELKEE
jgi:hypothetical protein